MKALLTSDIHVGIRKKNEIKFIDFAINYIKHIESYCKKCNIKNIFFLGDILEKSSNVRHEYFTPLFKILQKVITNGIDIYYILGNHDIYTKNNDSLVEVFPGKIIKKQENIIIENVDFNFLSYTEEPLENLTGDYLLTHLPIENFKMNQNYIPNKEYYKLSLFENFKKVFSGHYHFHQNNKNIIYLGSPFQLNFNETNSKKGFIILDTDKNDWKFIEYKKGPKFEIINKEYKIKNLKNTFVRLKLNQDDDFHTIKNELFKKGALSVEIDLTQEIKENATMEENIKLDTSLQDIIRNFLKNYKQNGIDNNKLIKIFNEAHKELKS